MSATHDWGLPLCHRTGLSNPVPEMDSRHQRLTTAPSFTQRVGLRLRASARPLVAVKKLWFEVTGHHGLDHKLRQRLDNSMLSNRPKSGPTSGPRAATTHDPSSHGAERSPKWVYRLAMCGSARVGRSPRDQTELLAERRNVGNVAGHAPAALCQLCYPT
jgi:hypothetical protein